MAKSTGKGYYVNKDQDVTTTASTDKGQMDTGKFKADFISRTPAEGANTYVAEGTKEGERPERGAGYKRGGKAVVKKKAPAKKVAVKKYARGGGIEQRGKTRGKFV